MREVGKEKNQIGVIPFGQLVKTINLGHIPLEIC